MHSLQAVSRLGSTNVSGLAMSAKSSGEATRQSLLFVSHCFAEGYVSLSQALLRSYRNNITRYKSGEMHFELNIEVTVLHKQCTEGLYCTILDLPSSCIFKKLIVIWKRIM